MGGYGTAIGETKSYIIYLMVNCSNANKIYEFNIYRKSDDRYIHFEQGCTDIDIKDLTKFDKELTEEHTIFFIKDKGIRDKSEFEYRFQQGRDSQELRDLMEHIGQLLERSGRQENHIED
ncbi:MAG: hypothetical protein KAS32_31440 [Candidatus Peribacteraceae bacterium]|nr:hypothetical protein [Candidatus Peribacteraceae bacterium]